MKTVRAYTVMEMLVVMLISSVSIGIAYSCYRIFSNQYVLFKRNSEDLYQHVLFDRLLTQEFSRSEKVTRSGDGIILHLKDKKLEYIFGSRYILRKDLVTDTFAIAPQDLQLSLEGHSQNLPGGLVETISFGADFRGEKIRFNYRKLYGADIWMLLEEQKQE